MTSGLATQAVRDLGDEVEPRLRGAILGFNDGQFAAGFDEIAAATESIEAARSLAGPEAEEDLLNDLFVLEALADLHRVYGELWQQVLAGEFQASWATLQNALDILRVVKRFSSIDVAWFERQLLEFECTYPYNIFFSVGMTVGHFECSVCGRDIDSLDCPHRRGELYRGQLATAIARDIAELKHVSMVILPEDKRCVVTYEDDGPQFRMVRYVADLLTSQGVGLLAFDHLRHGKRRIPNPEHHGLGRNDLCYCGSKKKFKRCCISKTTVEVDHVDVILEPFDAGRFGVAPNNGIEWTGPALDS